MNLASRAKRFAFASMFLLSLLFQPPVQTSTYRSIKNERPAQSQAALSKLLRSYTYRPFAGERNLIAPFRVMPTIAPDLSSYQQVNWGGYFDPILQRFLRKITDGESNVLKGIYAPGRFTLQVVQQPEGDWSFVSEAPGLVTQFQSATVPVTGILAHNFMDGKLFYALTVGDGLYLLYGDGFVRHYQVTGIYKYRKLDINSLSSDMIDLSSGMRVTTGDVFRKLYTGSERVTLQTCLEGEGFPNWGLYFVTAQPVISAQ